MFLAKVLLLKLGAVLDRSRIPESDRYDIILIKTGELGDYVLFRNFIRVVRETGRPGMRILLVGNRLWKDLALRLDSGLVDGFLWVAPDYAEYGRTDTGLLARVAGLHCRRLVNASFSRSPLSDILAFLVRADLKCCPDDASVSGSFSAALRRRIYGQRIGNDGAVHEFERNRRFFEKLTGTDIRFTRPVLQPPGDPYAGPDLPGHPYGVIAVGASDPRRRWPAGNVRMLIEHLIGTTGYELVLVGSATDALTFRALLQGMPDSTRIRDLAGRTSLPDLLQLLSGADWVVSNETGIIHMADAMDVPSVCILGGGHFDRFVPYSPEAGSRIVPVFEKLSCYQCDWNCTHPEFDGSVYPCIAAVGVHKVIKAVEEVLAGIPVADT
jgi:ADP-heptose:LPS heptosyltransferase